MSDTPSPQRFPLIDYLRVFAIFLMVVYHFTYDLYLFGYLERATAFHPLAIAVARTCLCLFLFCVGYSLALAHTPKIRWQAWRKNTAKVALAAALVSVVSYLVKPHYWIYFGILHCIAVSSVVALAFIRVPMLALCLGLVNMLAYWIKGAYLPWIRLDGGTLDYIALFPWGGMVLIGLGCASWQLHKKVRLPHNGLIETISRQSLLIYLLHQPLLTGLLWVYKQVTTA